MAPPMTTSTPLDPVTRILCWVLGRKSLQSDIARRGRFVRALQQLWVAGMAGTLFFAIARKLPSDFLEFIHAPSADVRLVIALKYLYVGWFVAYFLVSSMDNDEENAPRRLRDLGFDMAQSFATIVATYRMGFISPQQLQEIRPGMGLVAANCVIAAICLFSCVLYHDHARDGVNKLRMVGAVFALIGGVVGYVWEPVRPALYWMMACQLILWVVLAAYLRIGFDEAPIAPSG